MKWNHLPVDGGIYAQHPKLIDRFYYIIAEENKAEAEQQRRDQAKQNPGKIRRR